MNFDIFIITKLPHEQTTKILTQKQKQTINDKHCTKSNLNHKTGCIHQQQNLAKDIPTCIAGHQQFTSRNIKRIKLNERFTSSSELTTRRSAIAETTLQGAL